MLVWTITFIPFLRIYVCSCQCLYCRHCLSRAVPNGRCSRCKVGNVSVKAVGQELSPAAKNLFKTFMDQPSLESLTKKQMFKQKQLSRTIAIHRMYRERCNLEKKKLEQNFVNEREELRKLQRCKEEKIRRIRELKERGQVLMTFFSQRRSKEETMEIFEETEQSKQSLLSRQSFELENNERSTDSVDRRFLSF